MNTSEPPAEVQRAIWKPGWHRLDQPLRVGQSGRFWFFASAEDRGKEAGPASASPPLTDETLRFFCGTVSARHRPEVRSGTVVSLSHAVLGPLQAIDTAGLDYRFVKADGRELFVNAEEDTGAAYGETAEEVSDWTVDVLIHGLSGPLADLA